MADSQYRFDSFLIFLAHNGNVTKSAELAGLTADRNEAFAAAHPDFKAEMDKALGAAADRLRYVAWQRAVFGEEAPYYYRGEVVGMNRRPSDQLLVMLLRLFGQKERPSEQQAEYRRRLISQITEKLARLSETRGDINDDRAD